MLGVLLRVLGAEVGGHEVTNVSDRVHLNGG